MALVLDIVFFFFFNDTATTEIYTLSLHDALPISDTRDTDFIARLCDVYPDGRSFNLDRKSTRLNSSHSQISYAVFCLKKKINLHFPAFLSIFPLPPSNLSCRSFENNHDYIKLHYH